MSRKALIISSWRLDIWQSPDPASAKYCGVTGNRKRVKYLSYHQVEPSYPNGHIFQLVRQRMLRLVMLTVILSRMLIPRCLL
jgi:hypothetical protein